VQIERRFMDAMVTHALENEAEECCGVLAGTGHRFLELFRMTNVEHSPYRYSWDPQELYLIWKEMENSSWEHRAVYHSHTHSPAYPSETDVRLAAWPEAYYIIISLLNKESPDLQAFRIMDGIITAEPIEVT
jgi:proteasome lid subunit RPN8/RPN11